MRARADALWPDTGWPDALGVALAALAGLPSLAYGYGRDQALFHYVAREWLGGRWPYVDVFDLKPPGIYVAYFPSALLGDAFWPARVVDLCAVLITGALAGRLTDRPGGVGVGALLAVAVHYALFDFWHAGQTEIWQCLFVLAGVASGLGPGTLGAGSLGAGSARRRGLAAGLCAGLAVLFKLTAALPCLAIGLALAVRPRPGRALGWATLSGAATLAAPLALFAAVGAWSGVVDLARYLPAYAEARPAALGEASAAFLLDRAGVVTVLVVGAIVLLAARRTARRLPLALALLALSLGAVLVQRKLVVYHWGALVGPVAWLGALALTQARRRRTALTLAGLVAAVVIATGPPWQANPSLTYARFALQHAIPSGLDPRANLSLFRGESAWDLRFQVEAGERMRALGADPARDQLHARGFEPAYYVVSGLSSPARFVNETHFQEVREPFVRAWQREQEERLRAAAPRFFTGLIDRPRDLRELVRRGYVPILRRGRHVLLERQGGSRTFLTRSRFPAGFQAAAPLRSAVFRWSMSPRQSPRSPGASSRSCWSRWCSGASSPGSCSAAGCGSSPRRRASRPSAGGPCPPTSGPCSPRTSSARRAGATSSGR